jgi:predicted ATPase
VAGVATVPRGEDAFIRGTHDALAHLYDPSHLEVLPLAGGFGGGKGLRRSLETAIDDLRPRRDDRPDGRTLRRHELLRLRYLEGLPVEEVQRRLTIGRSEYYREHQQAVAAVASLLSRRSAHPPSSLLSVDDVKGEGPRVSAETPADRPSRLPIPATSFIGRDADLAEVVRLLGTTRLLTLTGAGGCGKTRLALHAATELRAAFPEGLYFVELAPLADPGLVVGTVAGILGLRDAPGQPMLDRVLRFIGDKRVLIVLDNCEHLVDVSARLIDAVLRGTSAAHVLATSRELLRVGGEVNWRVPSLPTPPPDAVSAQSVHDYPAVRLFADRASAVAPTFRITDENAPAVIRICQRLDGMPLALELAAARVRVLAVEEIAGRLDDRFRLLTVGDRAALPRQQTLRAVVDWSYELLPADERMLFRRLAVFAGGWTLAAAEAVCADDAVERGAVLDALTSLVDRSLAVGDGDARGARYRFSETVREYALERLAASADAGPSRDRHAAYFLALAERAAPELTGPAASAWLGRLELEHENLRATLRWCEQQGNAERGLRCATALVRFWMYRGDRGEALGWLEQLLALPAASPRTAVRAEALLAAADLATCREEYQRAAALADDALAIGRELDDTRLAADATAQLGFTAIRRGDFAGARELLEAALPRLRQTGRGWDASFALGALGAVASVAPDMPLARSLLAEGLTISRAIGHDWGIATSLGILGRISLEEDDLDAATASFAESLVAYRRLGDRGGSANALMNLSMVAARRGDSAQARVFLGESLPVYLELGETLYIAASLAVAAYIAAAAGSPVRAHTLLGSAEGIWQRLARRPVPVVHQWIDRSAAETADRIDEPARAAADAAGRAMTVEQAVAYALSDN